MVPETSLDEGRSGSHFRPWTVYLLVAFSVVGSIWGVADNGSIEPVEIAGSLIGLRITYSIWIGKTWAFQVSFMLASLCAVVILTISLVEALLLERGMNPALSWGFISSVVGIVLLSHPATKRFAGLPKVPQPN